MSDLDPYRDWLGVHSAGAKPTPHELLGLSADTHPSRKAIVAAAQSQLTKLKAVVAQADRDQMRRVVHAVKAAARELLAGAASQRNESRSRESPKPPPLSRNNPVASSPDANELEADDIPMAIPIEEQNLNGPSSSGTVIQSAADFPYNSASEVSITTDRATRKRRVNWSLRIGATVGLAIIVLVVLSFRPEVRALFLGRPAEKVQGPLQIPRGTADRSPLVPSANDNPPLPIPIAESNVASANPPQPTTTDIAPANDVTALLNPPSPTPSPTVSSPATPSIVKRTSVPNDYCDFLMRATLTHLTLNDMESAVESYSRLSEDNIDESRHATFRRLGWFANRYLAYRELLEISAATIAGGTTLEIGRERTPVALVETTPDFVIIRDRGRNLRFPMTMLPGMIAWEIIERTHPKHPTRPILEGVSTAVDHIARNVPASEWLPQVRNQLSATAVDPSDRDSLLQFIELDLNGLLRKPDAVIRSGELGSSLIAPSSDARPVGSLEERSDRWHLQVQTAFTEANPSARLTLLIELQRESMERGRVSDVIACAVEIDRWLPAETSATFEEALLTSFLSTEWDKSDAARLLSFLALRIDSLEATVEQERRDALVAVARQIRDRYELTAFAESWR